MTTQAAQRTTDVDGAAYALDVSPWSIRAMIRDGVISAVRIGRGTRRIHYRIALTEIDRLLANHGGAPGEVRS